MIPFKRVFNPIGMWKLGSFHGSLPLMARRGSCSGYIEQLVKVVYRTLKEVLKQNIWRSNKMSNGSNESKQWGWDRG